jgi:hypothetical protein
VIFSYCSANPGGFHRADGAGYAFWADQVLALDALNPEIAARLARALDNWSRYVPALRGPMQEALQRVLKHRKNIIRVNPADNELFEQALRCALTNLITGEACLPPRGSDGALRYLRDRISVPRDMSIYAAKHLRQSLENTAALVGDRQGLPLALRHRRDQDPANFASL